MRYLLPTFIVLPILEMYVLIKVGGNLGALNTVLLVLLTALIGVALLRVQGFRTLMNAKNKLGMAQLPAEEIITGLFRLLVNFSSNHFMDVSKIVPSILFSIAVSKQIISSG